MAERSLSMRYAGVLLLFASASLGAWQHPPTNAQASAESQSSRRWLYEDVACIITPEERRAFLALKSVSDREQSIEQFWLRRDPTPETIQNEAKEEHDRRLAYVKEHYPMGLTGCKTDRGRIYLLFGPPDEIESHPASGNTPAIERWRYSYIEGLVGKVVYEFVDSSRTGKYRLLKDPPNANIPPFGPGQFEMLIQYPTRKVSDAPGRIHIEPDAAREKLISMIDPVYPQLAWQARLEGVVRFKILIDKGGQISLTNLLSGHPLLVGRAEAALAQWRYQPTLVDGKPVEVITEAEVRFTLPH